MNPNATAANSPIPPVSSHSPHVGFEQIAPPRIYLDGRMDAKNAAAYLGLSVKTLANMRSRGTGPTFVKPGRVFYYKHDVDAWLNARRATSAAQARCEAGLGLRTLSEAADTPGQA